MNVESKLIQSKLGLLKLAEKLGNVSEACRVYGYSRDSFYRIKELFLPLLASHQQSKILIQLCYILPYRIFNCYYLQLEDRYKQTILIHLWKGDKELYFFNGL